MIVLRAKKISGRENRNKMKSYLFVPAVLPKINKSKTISPDEIILDFEDGLGKKIKPIRFTEIDLHFENKVWIRLKKSFVVGVLYT